MGSPLEASKFKVYRPRSITTTATTTYPSPQVSPTTSPRTISELFASFHCQEPGINRKRKYDSFASSSPSVAPSFDSLFQRYASLPANTACAEPPIIPEDRRPDRTRLRVASFNAEWLFLFGGSGSVQCPGPRCAWSVS